MEALDVACITHMCSHLSTAADLDSLGAYLSEARPDFVEAVMRAKQERADQWFHDAPRPTPESTDKEAGLDRAVKAFVLSEYPEVTVPDLSGQQQLWVQGRAQQLGLTTSLQSPVPAAHAGVPKKDLVMAKPPGWIFDFGVTRPIPQQQCKARDRYHRRYDRLVRCDECRHWLAHDEAWYHSCILGPLCDDCIAEHPEWDGIEWELY